MIGDSANRHRVDLKNEKISFTDQDGPGWATPVSWRVELLPYLDSVSLYRKYKHKDGWDSFANQKIAEYGMVHYRCPAIKKPNDAAFLSIANGKWATLENMVNPSGAESNSSSSDILLVEVCRSGVPWMEPRDIPRSGFQNGVIVSSHRGVVNVLFNDGSVRPVNPEVLKLHLHE